MSEAFPAGASAETIRATVDGILRHVSEADEMRQDLRARGVPVKAIRTLVELTGQGESGGLTELLDSTLAVAQEKHGTDVMDRETLVEKTEAIATIETDLEYARKQARDQGLDPQSLFFLINLIQRDPGDKGESAVNDFLNYALACGIPVHGKNATTETDEDEPESVLPVVDRAPAANRQNLVNSVMRDGVLGLCIGVGVMMLLV